MNNLWNAENSFDGQWDYLEKYSLGIRVLFANYIVYYPFDYSYSFSL